MAEEPTGPCPECGRDAEVVFGRCTNCGHMSDERFIPEPKILPSSGSFWEDLDWYYPALVGLILAVAAAVIRTIVQALT